METENHTDFSLDLGLLFYIVDPRKHVFAKTGDCPEYLNQIMPLLILLIVLEAVVNTYLRGKKYNMADSITSISFGLLMTLAGVSSRVLMISTYDWLHQYRLIDLPWDSVYTWILAAIGVDLGYYWFHRLSHEIGILWAVHQAHHSSEEFNLTTAFRQPVLEGLFWLTHWFYLPLALCIPTTQMLVHSELNFLFQFWIHTELVGDLGPLGLILNTSSFHKVHHGANRYCIDKNYGGFLSVWDRLFGTFQEELKDEEIVYGLVDQPQFFDVLKHQYFYFQLIYEKAKSTDSLKAWFYGPGWFPGLPRLGDVQSLPEKPERKIYYSKASKLTYLVILLHLGLIALIHDYVSREWSGLTCVEASIYGSYIVTSAYTFTLQLDGQHALEIIRSIVTMMCLHFGFIHMEMDTMIYQAVMIVNFITGGNSFFNYIRGN